MTLALAGAAEDAATAPVVGLSAVDMPFKGGTPVRSLDVLLAGLASGPDGGLLLSASRPAGRPP